MPHLRAALVVIVALFLTLNVPAQAARRLVGGGLVARRAARPGTSKVARQPLRQPAPVVAALPAEAAAPRLVTLTGFVRDAAGRPYPGVCVFPTTNGRQVAVTDASGAFQLQVPAHTALSLQAEYVGVGSSRVEVAAAGQPVAIILNR